ncbi:MAG: GAF domain-containing sensor histidine kinase [Melioribacteraceae bacterium]|nr:GAF domain-containing sensor histidine kinase [Melioribacteraceae bacterium]
MRIDPITKKMSELYSIRNTIFQCETIEQAITSTLEFIYMKIHPQVASVYLFSKNGMFKREKIIGKDFYGNDIPDDWYPDEEYLNGESFTGRVLQSDNNEYGSPVFSFNIKMEKNKIKPISFDNYEKKLGGLYSAIIVPLNGKNRTFGGIELINKTNKDFITIPDKYFTEGDFFWLSGLSFSLTNAISQIRRKNELDLVNSISRNLVKPFSPNFNLLETLNEIAKSLVNPLKYFSVCIIRYVKNDKLEKIINVGDNINWSLRIDEPILIGERIAGKVIENMAPVYIENLESHINDFRNIEWIKNNNLKSYACLPLIISDERIGTISIFTHFNYKFYKIDKEFLESIASLIATLIQSDKIIRELKDAKELIEHQKQNVEMDSLDNSFEANSYVHDIKNKMHIVLKSLDLITDRLTGKSHAIFKENISILDKIYWDARNRLETTVEIKNKEFDINKLFNGVIHEHKQKAIFANINFLTKYSNSIPILEMNLKEFDSFRQIIYNLLDNAQKAIREIRDKNGEIELITEIVEYKNQDCIKISIKDNGKGMTDKQKSIIFNGGYSAFSEGTGKGLKFVKNVVINNFGGKIYCESKFGKGTKFVILIPYKKFISV